MKIFAGKESSWLEKVNFVDDNDVFVGYDLGQSCCEYADWFIDDKISSEIYDGEVTPDVSSYFFDKEFFKEVEDAVLDGGGMVVFRLLSKDKPDLYLHLFNCHNGYYGHGFEVKHGGETVRSGCL